MRTTKNTKTPATKLSQAADVESTIAGMRAQIARLEARAKGTRDVTKEAASALRVGGDLSRDLGERVEMALRVRPRSADELARDLKEPAGKISAALKPLRDRLYNVGTDHAPAWFMIVGDDAPTEQVNAAVAALVSYKPMRFPELLEATGARQGRVSGAIVAMQRAEDSRIVNLDNPARARWFVLPEGIQLSRLKKR